MELLADENIQRDVVEALRGEGHDVMWIAEIAPTAPDDEVFSIAVRENRLLITFDLDFSDIIYREKRAGLRGLVQVRLDLRPRSRQVNEILRLWKLVDEWDGHTTVLEPGRVRQRPLPSGG